jgi:cardiolipin synthase
LKLKKALNTLCGRLVITATAILLQLLWLVYSVYSLSVYSEVVNIGLTVLSLLVVIYIINGSSAPEVKLAWIVPILAFPILGGFLFLISGGKGPRRKLARAVAQQRHRSLGALPDSKPLLETLDDPCLARQSGYLVGQAFPLYANTRARYYPTGESGYAALLEALEKAEKFIFLEYFIIAPGKMWDGVLDILRRKAAQGVDVRVMYDDVGCVSTLPFRYYKKLRAMGIQAIAFNPFVPFCSTIMNNRDHRKIVVIDGNTAFTGGVNLADEYINEIEKYGHWKDNMVMLSGEGVWSMTLMFLELWDACIGGEDDLTRYRPTLTAPSEGYVQPYCDTPLDREYLGENVYLDIINQARDYVYLMTPYLIIDSSMRTALTLAAKRGVDVRILTPGVPDKKVIWDLTRSHYPELLEAGVKIYEYTPGFLHAKVAVCDDELAVVGTINLDYRSLYLHFENACLFLKTPVVAETKADFLDTQAQSVQVTAEMTKSKRAHGTLLHSIYFAVLRLFAPLL